MKLNEYTKDEWYIISRSIKPELSRDEFEKMWEDFLTYKDFLSDVKGEC